MATKEQYEKFFDTADADHSGFLEKKELIKVMTSNGYTEKDAENLLRASDLSGDGKISKQEFLQSMGVIPGDQHADARMRQVFKQMDKDGNGTIDKTELKSVFKELGDNVDDKNLDSLLKKIDVDGDGKISYEEFIKVFHSVKA